MSKCRDDGRCQQAIDYGVPGHCPDGKCVQPLSGQAPLRCWSCWCLTTLEARAEADGNCPHCGVEIEL